MKKIISNITVVLFALLAMTACTDDNVSDLRLNGDCSVMAFAADEYEGTIDADKKVITVRVPETYNTESMTVTKLTLSDGAESNIKQGDVLNLAYPQVIHVANGNVSLDWTVNVKRDEAKILSFRINDTYTGVIDEANKTITVSVPNRISIPFRSSTASAGKTFSSSFSK